MKSKTPPKSTKKKAISNAHKRFIKLKEVQVSNNEPGQCQVKVELLCGDQLLIGERIGPDEQDYRVMLAALSTLDALQKATDERMRMELLFIERQQLEKVGREVIMVLIDINLDDSTRAATGACQISGDATETAARAVLDATNRMMEIYFDSADN